MPVGVWQIEYGGGAGEREDATLLLNSAASASTWTKHGGPEGGQQCVAGTVVAEGRAPPKLQPLPSLADCCHGNTLLGASFFLKKPEISEESYVDSSNFPTLARRVTVQPGPGHRAPCVAGASELWVPVMPFGGLGAGYKGVSGRRLLGLDTLMCTLLCGRHASVRSPSVRWPALQILGRFLNITSGNIT